MSLRAIHLRADNWIRRPAGQVAGLLLLLAVLLAGMPAGQVHAHADGGDAHDHAGQLAAVPADHGDPQDPVDPAHPVDPVDPPILHAHDAVTVVPALPTVATLSLGMPVPVGPVAHPSTAPPPSAARTPPHRPPIA